MAVGGKCKRPACTNKVPHGRRSYCSSLCKVFVMCKCETLEQAREKVKFLRAKKRASQRNKNVRYRVCLKCGKLFVSTGPWNRLCPRHDHTVIVERKVTIHKWR